MNADYPPLTPLQDVPLHGFELDDEREWACALREQRPSGDSVNFRSLSKDPQYDWRCADCVATAEAVLQRGEDPQQWWKHTAQSEPEVVSLGWLVARARYYSSR